VSADAPTQHGRPADPRGPLDPRERLRGQRILVMGGTGFLGKVFLSMLLCRFPEIGHVYLMVREKRGRDGAVRLSTDARFWSEIASSRPLAPLRAAHPGPAYETFLREKVTAIPGDVGDPFCGVPEDVRARLRGRVDVLVNVAGIVDFDPPLDYALKANAFGMQNLVALARDLGDLKVMHTSTCYVAGDRTGEVLESHPLSSLFPRIDELDPSHWDPQREIAECVDLCENVRHRSNDAFRQSDFLATAKHNLESKGEPARGSALEDELGKVKRRYVEQRLVDGGRERARFWGWHNIYTYTKSIGEQILASSGLTWAIVRPAIIESALAFPEPGWCEGINTSSPLIYLAQKTQLQVPAGPDSVLDFIPVDQVSIGMILSLAELCEGSHRPVYQYGTSDSAPLSMREVVELTGLYRRNKKLAAGGNPIVNAISARFEATPIGVDDYHKRGPRWRKDLLDGARGLLERVNSRPLDPILGPAIDGLQAAAKSLDVVARVSDTFLPFTATHNYRFSCANTRAAFQRLSAEDRALLPWQPETIDWRVYMLEVHAPGIDRHVTPLIEEKLVKKKEPLRPHDSLIDLLEELAERHDLATALMRTHEDGFTRVSFRDLRDRATAVAARLRAAGVEPTDRVLLSANNHPDWVVAWFGINRAGAVAVPLDPALTPEQVRVICASAQPAAAILGQKARDAFGEAFRDLVSQEGARDPAAVPLRAGAFDLHEVTDWGPLDGAPVLRPRGEHLASILYTSGTTGAPKGVMLTHGNFCSLLGSLGRVFPVGPDDRVLSVLPLHHAFEFSAGLLLPLSQGARIIYLDEINGDRLSYGLREGRVTCMVGVPALWQLLERRIRGQVKDKGRAAELAFDLGLELNRLVGRKTGLDLGRLLFGEVHQRLGGNIRILISGGAALPQETHTLFAGLGLNLAEGYGLTEASPVLTATVPRPGERPGHVGPAIPGVEVRIADANAEGIGEVLARGPNVMAGYFENPDATAAVIDADGWLHTGDLGRLDHKDRLHILGRQKDVVVAASGENIYLDDVEHRLGTVAWVKEYCLCGIPDPRGGERLGLLAVPADEPTLDRNTRHARAQDALRVAIDKLPAVQRPAVLHLVDADLPRTSSRKVKRKDVAAILQKIASAAPVRGKKGEGISGPVAQAIAAVAGADLARVGPDSRLSEDLGYDSLMWVELASALQGVGTGRPDPDALSKCATVADVVALVGAPPPEIVPDRDKVDPVRIPDVVAQPLKGALGFGQRSLYTRALHTSVEGSAFIPQNRQTIVVSNHCSHLDMGLVKTALGPYGRKLVALAAKDYFFEGNRWIVAYFEQLTNLQPIDRKAGFRASFEQARKVVEDGHVVLIFPEGTRRTDGSLGDFRPMIGKLALETGVDILPLYLDGTFRVLPKGAVLPRGRSVTVRIGAPLPMDRMRALTAHMKPADAARAVTELARSAVEHLHRGAVLDPAGIHTLDETPAAPAEPRIEEVFADLERRFDPARVEKPITWYFSLGGEDGTRWTVQIDPTTCQVRPGRPEGGKADCVVKTSSATFTRIVREAYVPSPDEFISGAIKTNDIPLLVELSRVFNLSEGVEMGL
jgi:long-chain acyl-CoA synthetase